MSRSFLEVDDLDSARLTAVLDRAIAWKAEPASVPKVLAGHGVAALFEKPSARTRISVEMAVSSGSPGMSTTGRRSVTQPTRATPPARITASSRPERSPSPTRTQMIPRNASISTG